MPRAQWGPFQPPSERRARSSLFPSPFPPPSHPSFLSSNADFHNHCHIRRPNLQIKLFHDFNSQPGHIWLLNVFNRIPYGHCKCNMFKAKIIIFHKLTSFPAFPRSVNKTSLSIQMIKKEPYISFLKLFSFISTVFFISHIKSNHRPSTVFTIFHHCSHYPC